MSTTLASEPSAVINPFIYGKPILDPDRFCGRAEEVRRVFACQRKAESVSIVGERRIGKISLLEYIEDQGVREKHGLGLEKNADNLSRL